MSDNGFDLGAALTGFVVGALLFGDRRGVSHQHGHYWHTHSIPAGYHVHDGGPDGPIRRVPPTPAQLEAQRRHNARVRTGWAWAIGLIGLAVLIAGAPFGLVLVAFALLLADRSRAAIDVWFRSWLAADEEVESSGQQDEPPSGELRPTSVPAPRTRVGPFLISHVSVWNDDGSYRIVGRLQNASGRTVHAARVTATVFRRDVIVAVGSDFVRNVEAGGQRTVDCPTTSAHGPHDNVVFQVDQEDRS